MTCGHPIIPEFIYVLCMFLTLSPVTVPVYLKMHGMDVIMTLIERTHGLIMVIIRTHIGTPGVHAALLGRGHRLLHP
jgi:hypothetical protein